MKTALFADGYVGLDIAKFLIEHYPEDLSLVVVVKKNDIYRLAELNGVPVIVFHSTAQAMSHLSEKIDLGVLAWWPKILKSPLLELPKWGFVNTHPSLLPYNRGKHYNFWALVERSPFGVTLHRVDSGVDTGDVIAQQCIHYNWCDTGETLYRKAQIEMIRLFGRTYPSLRTGKFKATPQNLSAGSFHYSSEIEAASHIELDQLYLARELINLFRARTFEGYPGCWFEEDGVRYEISINIRKIDERS